MSIDIGALRKFQDMWEPVLQAIPAVMELEAKKADMERWLASEQAKLAKAQAEVAATYEEADKRLEAVNKQLAAAMEDTAAAKAEAAEIKRSAAEKAKEAMAKAQAKVDALDQQTLYQAAALKTISDEYATKLSQAQAAHAMAVKGMEAEIIDLEKRKAAAEKALDTLRAKLG